MLVKHPGKILCFCFPGVVAVLCLLYCSSSKPVPSSITITAPYELSSLDPHEKDTISNYAVLANFYDPLVRTGRNTELIPSLAASWENPDIQTWRFHLRKGVRFHNGKEFTSDDVIYTFERLLHNRELEVSGYITNILEIRATGKYGVEIKLGQPTGVFLNKLNFILIIPQGSSRTTLTQTVNGTGPYRLVRWTKGESIVLKANQDYWGGPPFIQNATFLLNRSPEQALQDFEFEKSQLIQCNLKSMERLFSMKTNYSALRHESPYVKYLGYDLMRDKTPFCDTEKNPFKNKLVREALHIAIDRHEIVRELSIFAIVNPHPIPPLVFGYPPNLPSVKPDRSRARRLLAEAGFPDGFHAKLHARRILQKTAFLVQKQLKQVGIVLEVEVLADEDWFEKMREPRMSFFLSRFGCPTGDASDFLEMAVHSFDRERGYGSRNYARYRNPNLDRMIEEAAGLTLSKRAALLREILTLVDRELVWIPLYIDEEVYALHRSFRWEPRNDSYIFVAEIGPAQN